MQLVYFWWHLLSTVLIVYFQQFNEIAVGNFSIHHFFCMLVEYRSETNILLFVIQLIPLFLKREFTVTNIRVKPYDKQLPERWISHLCIKCLHDLTYQKRFLD